MAATGGRVGGASDDDVELYSYDDQYYLDDDRYFRNPRGSLSTRYYHDDGRYLKNLPNSWLRRLGFLVLVAVLAIVIIGGSNKKIRVLKLQVCLSGTARSLQRDLDRITNTADTSSSKGLSAVLDATAQSLLSLPDYYISADLSADVEYSSMGWKKMFNQLSTEESGKFGEVTLSNVNNIKKRSSQLYLPRQRSSKFSNEYIVVTILVAADGVQELPTINTRTDLEKALRQLVSIPASKTKAVEILWTPQQEDDALYEEQLHKNYPALRPLMN